MGLEETKEAIDAAGRAFVTWGRTTAKVRFRSSKRMSKGITISHDVVVATTRHSRKVLQSDEGT
jgi:acyl-CoA reductase-like NAD-dependent aldehyde dehydrogenase